VEAVAKERNNPTAADSSCHDGSDGSPFPIPPVTSFYPLEDSEKKAIERVLRAHEAERRREASKPASAT
jgi:hypothetical protein